MMSTDSGPAASAQAVVQAEGLAKAYGDVQALQGVSFSIPAGSVVGFLGPNGAGKTTAIKILTGSLAADAGRALICGYDVETEPQAARASIGYLPENNPLYPEMRVDRFLRFAWEAQRSPLVSETREQAIDRVVQATGLASVYRRAIGNCSKGFRQRVGFAQALLHDPPLLILDEPTNGLDPLQVVEIRELIRRLGRTKTVLLTTHVLPEVEALAERVVLIHQGRKVADDRLESLATGEMGRLLQLTVQGRTEQLTQALAGIEHEMVQLRTGAYGLSDACRALLRIPRLDASSLAGISAAVHAADLRLLELSPQAGGLESLFQGLDASLAISEGRGTA
jgi:ABC-2 type transport system ATP-binding protein